MRESEEIFIRNTIEKCPLFDNIDISALHPVYREFHRREEIYDVQDGVPCIGIIGTGEADVYTISDELSQPNVSTQKPGSVFGICNVYLSDRMPTKLVCKVHCEVVFIPKAEFRGLVESDQKLQQRYLQLCNRKILYLAEKIELMGIGSVRSKLAWYLLRNADENGKVVLATSKEQFAKYLNVGRASLFRSIAEFTDKNLISYQENEFQILDEEGLNDVRKGEKQG